jgi:hypothetical protein
MTLALEFGRHDVDKFASELTSRQLTEWMAFDRLSPIGGERLDANSALIAWTNYKTATGDKKLGIKDFVLTYGRPAKRKRETPEQQKARINAAFLAMIARSKPREAQGNQ